jgi:hypothetical protein
MYKTGKLCFRKVENRQTRRKIRTETLKNREAVRTKAENHASGRLKTGRLAGKYVLKP